MRNHDAPSGTEGVFGSLDRLSDGTDLVDLQQKCVTRLELNGLLDELGVGDSQVITGARLVKVGIRNFATYPTIWKSEVLKKYDHASQSSSAKGSSILTMGYFCASDLYSSASCS